MNDCTNLFYSGKDIDELCSVVSIEVDKLCIWFQVNKLSLNTSKTNFMIFTNRSCDDTYSVCMNGLNLSRVFVTKFLGVHMDSKLDWNYHIGIVRNKVAKNVSVMNRVKHVLTSSALYSSLYCTLVMPYITYCCEVWGNNYKTRIQSLFILQKRATVEPVLGDHPFCPAKAVAQDRWSLITGRTKIMFYRLSDLCTLLHTLAVGLIEAGMALA